MKGNLLTVGNPKTEKGSEYGYLTAVLHLAPFRLSGRNVCPGATPGCVAGCLNTAGRGGIARAVVDVGGFALPDNAIQRARIARTQLLYSDRAGFLARLEREIAAHVRRAGRHGLKPAVRLNGTSDLWWPAIAPKIFERFPTVRFYDYTKVSAYFTRKRPANYDLTLSRGEGRDREARAALLTGERVAVVFDVLPGTYLGAPVIDGDAHDLRFTEPGGVVVGLKAKGRARRDASGFVVRTQGERI